MHYAPHILQKRIAPVQETDDLGRPVVIAPEREWEEICACRCDHNSDQLRSTVDGKLYVPQYKAVCGRNDPPVFPSDEVRVLNADGSEKCKGTVSDTQKLNYLPYAVIYF